MRERALPALAAAAFLSIVPVAVLHFVGHEPAMIPGWVHLVGVSVTAGLATVAAAALTYVGARERDGRATIVGCAFSIMAALLLLHGITTPYLLFDMNGVVAFTGAATLPIGGTVLALSAVPALQRPHMVKPLLRGLAVSVVGIVVLGVVALVSPSLVPAVPAAMSKPALGLLAAGLAFFALLFWRAVRTYRLTRRRGDLSVAVGLVWLGAALVPSLTLGVWELGWWLGHGFEVVGIFFVGGAVALDLRRGTAHRSRALVGDLSAVELVLAEEAFLGSHVRALLADLARKDVSTEQHCRRVALLGVQIGELLGLSPDRLRALALGGLLHDIGKLAVPCEILSKPAALTGDEFDEIKRHPVNGELLLQELGGFQPAVLTCVRDHHERLDGSGYPYGRHGAELALESRILAVCDVYDALVSPRVYRDPWPHERAMALLRDGAGPEFDARVVAALERVLADARGRTLRVAV